MNNKLLKKTIIPLFFVFGICFVMLSSVLSGPILTEETETLTASPIAFGLFIDGIDGESKDSGREGSIDVISYSHSIKVKMTLSRSDIIHTPFRIVKMIDKASPKLAEALSEGNYEEVVFRAYYRSTPMDIKFLEIQFHNALITSISTYGTTSSEGMPLETVSFVYERITWTYTEFDEMGKPKGTVSYMAYWDGVPPG